MYRAGLLTMKGSITKDYSAYKMTTGYARQDLALVFGEGVADEKYISFKVSWIEQATIEIVKERRYSGCQSCRCSIRCIQR